MGGDCKATRERVSEMGGDVTISRVSSHLLISNCFLFSPGPGAGALWQRRRRRAARRAAALAAPERRRDSSPAARRRAARARRRAAAGPARRARKRCAARKRRSARERGRARPASGPGAGSGGRDADAADLRPNLSARRGSGPRARARRGHAPRAPRPAVGALDAAGRQRARPRPPPSLPPVQSGHVSSIPPY